MTPRCGLSGRPGAENCRCGGRPTLATRSTERLDLADEFGTTAVIVGGREAAKVADRLKAEHVAVILPLSFPEEPKVPTEEEYRKRPLLEQEEPLKLLAHRRDKWKEQVATAAALAKAGIPFAFATEGLERLDSFPASFAP